MLVTYRRVAKGTSQSPTTDVSTTPTSAQPIAHLHNAQPRTRRDVAHERAIALSDAVLQREDTRQGMGIEEAEMPEVVLDRNRHIVPKWMLRMNGLRSRSYSQSYSTAPHMSRGRVTPVHLNAATASSPALILNERYQGSNKRQLSRQATHPAIADESSHSADRFLSPGPSALRSMGAQNERMSGRDLRQFHSDTNILRDSTPGWFGGTGSTTVNMKLKDHVFNTVLRRFQRRGQRCLSSWGMKLNDSGDTASGGGHVTSSAMSWPHSSCPMWPAEGLGQRNLARSAGTIRRAQSECAVDQGGGQDASVESDPSELGARDEGGSRLTRATRSRLGHSFSRRKNRSGSFDLSTSPRYRASPLPDRPLSSNTSEDSVTRQHHFILMEDLTGRLKHSCVLDLKMGTRQYGMDATTAKKKSQRKKCDRTTSRPLGVRVCGMQVSYQGSQVCAELNATAMYRCGTMSPSLT